MGSSLRTTCPICGDVEVSFAAARMLVALDAWGADNLVEFDCPDCGRIGQQRLDERSIRLLLAAGIEVAITQPAPGSSREASHNDRGR